MAVATVEPVPLYPRRRLLGTPFGGATSVRRGEGSDVTSSRPYQPGDHFHSIDWKSSARLSAARGSDEFIVRERYAEEMPRVVLVVDRRPAMALYPPDLPWLHKPAALAAVAELIVASALNQRGLVGYLDLASHPGEAEAGAPFWQPPRGEAGVWQLGLRERIAGYLSGRFDAPEETLERALAFLAAVRGAIPIGSFLFVLSDFTAQPRPGAWAHALASGWDIVPVIVQDRVWEQSFPLIDGVLAPFCDPAGGRLRFVRLARREVEERRRANEARLAALRSDFVRLGLDSVLIDDASPDAVRSAFVSWVEGRLELRGQRW